MTSTIGIAGIGLLGTAIAKRLTQAGFSLIGFDPNPEAVARLEALGGAAAGSIEEVARKCRRIILSLPGPAEVNAAIERIEVHLQPHSIILDTTTGDPLLVDSISSRLRARDAAYLDCEVGGSSKQTANGEAILLCGGDQDRLAECQDLLRAVSTAVFHMGPAGSGTRMKLALNICIGLHRAVLAESLEFARACGIDPEAALAVLKSGPAYSRAMDVKGRKMLSRDFAPEARLAQHLKDVRLILKTGSITAARLPLSSVHERLLAEAVDRGWGALDNSAIINIFSAAASEGSR